jgi:hypothetical protein
MKRTDRAPRAKSGFLKELKRQLATCLAATMVFSVVAGAFPAYGANDDAATIVFDPQGGPNLSHAVLPGTMTPYLPSGYGAGLGLNPAANNTSKAVGPGGGTSGQGYALTTSPDFAGFTGSTYLENPPGSSGDRPKLPDFPANIWDGYTFMGWSKTQSEADVLPYLPFAFTYVATTTYNAIWVSNKTVKKPLTVIHYRDFDPNRRTQSGQNPASPPVTYPTTNGAAWPAPTTLYPAAGANWVQFMPSTAQTYAADEVISAARRTDIPGYEVDSVIIQGNWKRRFDDVAGAGTFGLGTNKDQPAASVSAAPTYKLSGTMPNDALTVGYRYKPSSKTFTLTYRYVDENGAAISGQPPVTATYHAEDAIVSHTPPTISNYTLITTGANKPAVTVGDSGDNLAQGLIGFTGMNKLLNPTTFTSAADAFSGAGEFSAGAAGQVYMPNQNVTVTYKYKVNGSPVSVDTYYGNSMTADETYVYRDSSGNLPAPNTLFWVDVPVKAGYVYPPVITLSPSVTGGSTQTPTNASPKIEVKGGTTAGTVSLQYSIDTTDTTSWTTVYYTYYTHGSIAVAYENPKTFASGTYPINDLMQGIPGLETPAADLHWRFKGWYQADAAGTAPAVDPATNAPLTSVTLTGGQYKLIAVFEEDPAYWFTVDFAAGPNGTVSGANSQYVEVGTAFGSLNIPTYTANSLYLPDHGSSGTDLAWFNDAVYPPARVSPTDIIGANQTFTAHFVFAVPDTGLLSVPDASGEVATADGTGFIQVYGPNAARHYVVTDKDGNIIDMKSGGALVSGNFTGLTPSSDYLVYEISDTTAAGISLPGAVGTDLVSLVGISNVSQPKRVIIPALGSNYSVSVPGPNSRGTITISPAAPGTEYALVDENGDMVKDFTASAGSPLQVVFDDLDTDHTYTVVARPVGDTSTVDDKYVSGTNVSVMAPHPTQYTVYVMNGGYVNKVVDSSGNIFNYGVTTDTAVVVHAGDTVTLDAQVTIPGGSASFDHWSVDTGGITLSSTTSMMPTFTMPDRDVVVSAAYTYSSLPANAGLALGWDPRATVEGKVGMDLANNEYETILGNLIANPTDATAIGSGFPLLYTVVFGRRNPTSTSPSATPSEADALRSAHSASAAGTTPWVVETRVERTVGGSTSANTDAAYITARDAQAFTMYVILSDENRNGQYYEVYELDYDDNGTPNDRSDDYFTGGTTLVTPLTPSPEPGSGSGFTGMISFPAVIGKRYGLVFSKMYSVEIYDTKRGGAAVPVTVEQGDALDDGIGFAAGGWTSNTVWADPMTGETWKFKGFSHNASAAPSSAQPADTITPNTSVPNPNGTYYAIYERWDDPAWVAAHDDLMNKINEANALANSGYLTAADEANLRNAISDALNAYNRVPRATIPDLVLAKVDLQAAINVVSTGGGVILSYDADLSALGVSPGWLSPAFDPSVTSYTVNVPNGVMGLTVSATQDDPLATLFGDGYYALAVGPNVIVITVTSTNGTVKTYTITVNRASATSGSSGGGGGGGGGSSSKSGSATGPSNVTNYYHTYTDGIDGHWNNFDPDGYGWEFILGNGAKLTGTWANVKYTYEGTSEILTYHFDENGVMNSGWYLDTDGSWYYLSESHDGWFGHAVKGWYHDDKDGRWYYMSPVNSKMLTGWQEVAGEWYYFTADNSEATYSYSAALDQWVYTNPNAAARPLGSMYANELTPDGYQVGASGAWLRAVP